MKTILFTFTILALSSCAPTLNFYTKDIHDTNRWSESELKRIQFYLSGEIRLWREINRGETRITRGKIIMVNGREAEEVVVAKGTPGVYLFSPQKNHYAISFEGGEDDKYLVFGPSEKVKGRYVLLAKEWEKSYGKVTYGGRLFNTPNESAYAYLMVDLDKTRKTRISSTKIGGRKVE